VAAIEQLVASCLKCAIVSNGKSPFQQRNFAALGIAHLFKAVIVSSAVGLRKPAPAIFKLLLISGCRRSKMSFCFARIINDLQSLIMTTHPVLRQ